MASIDAIASDVGPLLHWLLRTSVSAAGIALLIVLVQTMLSRWLTPAWRYRLWALLVLRLMLPVLPSSPTSISNLTRLLPRTAHAAKPTEISTTLVPSPAPQPVQPSRWETVITVVADGARAIVPTAPPPSKPADRPTPLTIPLPLIAASVWAAIAILLLARLIIANILLARRLRRSTPAADPHLLAMLGECCQRMRVPKAPRLLMTSLVRAPATAGIWRPSILLPPNLLDSLREEEIRLILLHELAHVRCRDVALNWLLAILQIINWFNPVLWWAMARLRSDREAARDAMVLRLTAPQNHPSAPGDYVQTLLKLTEFVSKCPGGIARPATVAGMIEPSLSGMLGGRRSLQRRFTMIERFATQSRRLALLGPVVLLVLGTIFLTDARGAREQTPKPDQKNAATQSVQQKVSAADDPLETDRDRAMSAKLDRQFPTVQFDNVGFTDVIDYLGAVSGAKISVNWKALESAGIERDTPVSASLRTVKFSKALNAILDAVGGGQTKLGYAIDNGVITISTKQDLWTNAVIRVYDVRDLLAAPSAPISTKSPPRPATESARQESVDSLERLIMDTIEPPSWKERGGPVAAMRELEGQLIVTQTKDNHRQLINLLAQLRDQLSKPAASQPQKYIPADDPKVVQRERAIVAMLDRPLPSVQFDALNFSDVVDFLRDVSGAVVFVNWKALEAAGVERNTPVSASFRNVKFSKVLTVILTSAGGGKGKLGYTVDQGIITISTADDLAKNVIVRVYDIRDLVASEPTAKTENTKSAADAQTKTARVFAGSWAGTDPKKLDSLLQLIMDKIDSPSWKERAGSAGAMRELKGQLIVTQTKENHRQLINLLEQLREQRRKPATQP